MRSAVLQCAKVERVIFPSEGKREREIEVVT